MTGAGDLSHRVVLQKQGATSDGAGGTTTAFADQFTVWAGYTNPRSGESVMAGRLAGKPTKVVRIRCSSQARQVTTDWRLRDHRTGELFNIREVTETEDRAFVDLLCEGGVAA